MSLWESLHIFSCNNNNVIYTGLLTLSVIGVGVTTRVHVAGPLFDGLLTYKLTDWLIDTRYVQRLRPISDFEIGAYVYV